MDDLRPVDHLARDPQAAFPPGAYPDDVADDVEALRRGGDEGVELVAPRADVEALGWADRGVTEFRKMKGGGFSFGVRRRHERSSRFSKALNPAKDDGPV